MKRPSPAMIVALTALVFSMGGTAVAARRYLITSTSQIKPSVLRTLEKRVDPNPQVGASLGAPTGATGPEGKEGKQGAPGMGVSVIGPSGLQGNEGLRGPPGLEGKRGETGSAFAQVHIYEETSAPLMPGEHRKEGMEAHCTGVGRPVGGGFTTEQYVHVYASEPNLANPGWSVAAINEGASEASVTIYAVCAE